MYDSLEFLPPAKRARFETGSIKNNEVIRTRVPSASDVLPTLCASYTRQHELAKHLAQKGIFACIKEEASGFCYFDPAMFCSLFGATEHVVLSAKIGESFHFIGNAITVPHSVLSLCIVMHSVCESKIDPVGLVRQAWRARLSAYNSILFAHQGLVHTISRQDLWSWLSIHELEPEDQNRSWHISGTCADRHVVFYAHSDQTLKQVLLEQLRGPISIIEQLCGLNEDIRTDDRSTIEQIAKQEASFRLGPCHTWPRHHLPMPFDRPY